LLRDEDGAEEHDQQGHNGQHNGGMFRVASPHFGFSSGMFFFLARKEDRLLLLVQRGGIPAS
jgi:hypothetical protein